MQFTTDVLVHSRAPGVAKGALPRFLLALLTLGVAPGTFSQTIDAFSPQPSATPTTLAIQADGKILLGGYFVKSGGTFAGVQRLNSNGSVDASFVETDVSSEVKAVAVQADGKILIGGGFVLVGGQAHHYLARLNADGSLDASFADPNLDDYVWAVALQADGKVLAVGDFQNAGITARAYAARFTSLGALDAGFADTQICCGPARAVALQSNGDVLVGGYFLGVAGNSSIGGIARFSANGTLDAAFPVDSSSTTVSTIVVAPDDTIYVGTSYNTTDQTSQRPVARLSANGTLDTAYADIHTDSGTGALTLQPNGKVLFGGIFQLVDGLPRHALARLNANGSLDTSFADLQFSFSAGDANGYVYGLAAQADGKVIAIGNFTLANGGQPRENVARVVTGGAVASTLTGQASGGSVIVAWTRTGDGPELAQAPTLMYTSNGVNFVAVGTMTRIATGWQMTANYNVSGAPFNLQAVGATSNGTANGSSGQIASPIYVSDRIFANGFE